MANYNASQIGFLIKAFKAGGTCQDIAENTGFALSTVMRYARVWHRQGIIYVREWRRERGTFKAVKVWALKTNGQEDAPKPRPLTQAERDLRVVLKRKGWSKEQLLVSMYERHV